MFLNKLRAFEHSPSAILKTFFASIARFSCRGVVNCYSITLYHHAPPPSQVVVRGFDIMGVNLASAAAASSEFSVAAAATFSLFDGRKGNNF